MLHASCPPLVLTLKAPAGGNIGLLLDSAPKVNPPDHMALPPPNLTFPFPPLLSPSTPPFPSQPSPPFHSLYSLLSRPLLPLSSRQAALTCQPSAPNPKSTHPDPCSSSHVPTTHAAHSGSLLPPQPIAFRSQSFQSHPPHPRFCIFTFRSFLKGTFVSKLAHLGSQAVQALEPLCRSAEAAATTS